MALVSGVCAMTCLGGEAGPAGLHKRSPVASEIRNARVSHVVGMKVENRDGERLGKINNLVMDMRSGEVTYAIVSSGGFLGVRPQVRAVPAKALSMATAKKGVVALDVSLRRWKRAPVWKDRDLNALKEIDTFYAEPIHAVKSDEGTGFPRGTAVASATGTESGQPEKPAGPRADLHLTSDVVGRDVINRQHQTIGETFELLVDFSGRKPTLAILSVNRLLKQPQSFVVPVRMLSRTSGDQFMIDATRSWFEQAETFDLKAWEAVGASGAGHVYRYVTR